MSADDLWNVSLFVHALAPRMTEREGVRCPASAGPFETQELFGVRNLLRTTHLEAEPRIGGFGAMVIGGSVGPSSGRAIK